MYVLFRFSSSLELIWRTTPKWINLPSLGSILCQTTYIIFFFLFARYCKHWVFINLLFSLAIRHLRARSLLYSVIEGMVVRMTSTHWMLLFLKNWIKLTIHILHLKTLHLTRSADHIILSEQRLISTNLINWLLLWVTKILLYLARANYYSFRKLTNKTLFVRMMRLSISDIVIKTASPQMLNIIINKF